MKKIINLLFFMIFISLSLNSFALLKGRDTAVITINASQPPFQLQSVGSQNVTITTTGQANKYLIDVSGSDEEATGKLTFLPSYYATGCKIETEQSVDLTVKDFRVQRIGDPKPFSVTGIGCSYKSATVHTTRGAGNNFNMTVTMSSK